MQVKNLIEYFEEAEDEPVSLHQKKLKKGRVVKVKKSLADVSIQTNRDTVSIQHESDIDLLETGFAFSYKPALYEVSWLFSSLGQFYIDQWFDDILRKVKGGKEASVYLCQANQQAGVPYLAAKVYRPRQFRNLRKDHVYREGRSILDSQGNVIKDHGQLHAIEKKTNLGKELIHASWLEHEVKTLHVLHEEGADVPRVYASSTMTILMDYIGDENGCAPTLQEVHLSTREARILFERVHHNIEVMLSKGIIHGDLSAYNILYWDGAITLIDFPQMVSPENNPNAFSIFKRDMKRICEYFARQGYEKDGEKTAVDLWKKFRYRTSPSVNPAWLDPEDPEDRKAWESKTA